MVVDMEALVIVIPMEDSQHNHLIHLKAITKAMEKSRAAPVIKSLASSRGALTAVVMINA